MLGGSEIPVESHNREEYVRLYMKYMMHDSIHKQFTAFKAGFDMLCGHDTQSSGEYDAPVIGKARGVGDKGRD